MPRIARGLLLVFAFACLTPVVTLGASPSPTTPGSSPPVSDPAMTWGVQPSGADGPDGRPAFDYTLASGAVVTDYVGISNFGNAPLTVHLYATDAFNTDDGGFALLTADQQPTDVGRWVEFAEATHTIPARKRLDIPFRLRVPDDAEPGDHIGGIVASLEVKTTDANGNGVIVDRRVGSRIYLRVDGPVEASMALETLEVTYDSGWDPIAGTLTVRFSMRNTGNVRLAARQRVDVSGPLGWTLRSLTLDDLPELLPGSAASATTTVAAVPPVGPLSATVRIEPYTTSNVAAAAVAPLEATGGAWAWPFLLAGMILLAIEAIIGLVWLRRRRHKLAVAEVERALEAARAEGLALGRAQAEAPAQPGARPPGGA